MSDLDAKARDKHSVATLFDLTGQRALVTGASTGLGRHFALALARSGAEVILAGRTASTLADAVDAVRAEGGKAQAMSLDVSDAASVSAALTALTQAQSLPTILINNAGTTVSKPILDQTEQDWDQVLDTNLKGAFLMATECARRWRAEQQPGVIVNIASILGLRQAGAVGPYAASKAGLIQFTKELALELARFQIRVNAIAPGYIESGLNSEFFASEAGQRLIQRIPQRRLGTVEDLTGALLLLASDASRFMTGSVIAVDGGHLVSSL